MQITISSHPDILSGAACFHGTRIPISSVARYHQAGVPLEKINEKYPSLTEEEIQMAA